MRTPAALEDTGGQAPQAASSWPGLGFRTWDMGKRHLPPRLRQIGGRVGAAVVSCKGCKATAAGAGGAGVSGVSRPWWGTHRPRQDSNNFYFENGQTQEQRVGGTTWVIGRVSGGAGCRSRAAPHPQHTHTGTWTAGSPGSMDPQAPQAQPCRMPAKQEQGMIPLGPHRCHLVTGVLGARPVAAG